MLKLWNKRLLLHSSPARGLPFWGKSSLAEATNDFMLSRDMSTESASMSPKSGAYGESAPKIYAPFSIFKGKAAFAVTPMMPKFVQVESGSGFKIHRSGGILFTFRPAIGERRYDSEKSQNFALSPTEVGSIISLGSKGSCEFFHDPSMKTGNAGQINKKLTVNAHADGSGYFFSLNVMDNNLKTSERFVVPVTTAEYEVLRTSFTYALPHILGWNQYANPQLSHQNPPPQRNQYARKSVGELVGTDWGFRPDRLV